MPTLATVICPSNKTTRPRFVSLERIPFQRNRNSLSLSLSGRIFCGEPVSTSPENALTGDPRDRHGFARGSQHSYVACVRPVSGGGK